MHDLLTELGAQQPVGAHGLVALDWWSGNRSLLVDHELSGVIVGMTLATRPPDIYRALLESTAFGTRMIVEAFVAAGLPVTELVVAGGLLTNKVLMQIYADVTRRPLALIGSAQGPALGSAIHAAVAAGCYPDVPAAADTWDGGPPRPTCRTRTGPTRTTASTTSTARCTTTSAAAATTSCTASARVGTWSDRRPRHGRRCRFRWAEAADLAVAG